MLCHIMLPFLPARTACHATSRHIVSCHLLPLRGDEQFPFFSSSPSFWEQRRQQARVIFIFPFHLFANSARHPAGQRLRPPTACLPSSSAPPLPPCSRCGRPVSAKPIEKQRPKMYFPVSSPSLTSKHSEVRWKKKARRIFFAHDDFHCCRATFSAAKI